ncbi:hypothetical protein GNI_230000, partial [Gregarina niphandrodes]
CVHETTTTPAPTTPPIQSSTAVGPPPTQTLPATTTPPIQSSTAVPPPPTQTLPATTTPPIHSSTAVGPTPTQTLPATTTVPVTLPPVTTAGECVCPCEACTCCPEVVIRLLRKPSKLHLD